MRESRPPREKREITPEDIENTEKYLKEKIKERIVPKDAKVEAEAPHIVKIVSEHRKHYVPKEKFDHKPKDRRGN